MGKIGQIVTKSFYLPWTNIEITVNIETLIMTGIVMFILTGIGFWLSRGLKILPDRKQTAAEMLITSFDDILKDTLGQEDARKFLPFILTLFLFVLISNWIVLIPGLSSPTKDLNTCLGLGLMVFVICHFWAIKKKGFKEYAKAYFEPFWILFPSNIFSELGKVLSHSFRLFGNIFAGGVVIGVVPVIMVKLFKGWGYGINVIMLPGLNFFFGIFLSGIQAFVFAMLAIAYISVLSE